MIKMAIGVPFGLGKVQRLPYQLWDELRECSGRGELIEFIQSNEAVLSDLLSDRLSQGKVERLFRAGSIDKRQEAYYVAEVIKSAILRGGGSSIMSWALWNSNRGSEPEFKRIPYDGLVLKIAGIDVKVPVSYVIALDNNLIERIGKATVMIHDALTGGKKKLLTRADYVLECDGMALKPCLIDVGESNLSFALTDALFEKLSIPVPSTLEMYIKNVFDSYDGTPSSISVIAEDLRIIANMPYEFAALCEALRKKMPSKSQISNVSLANLDELAESGLGECESALRCFRSRDGGDKYRSLEGTNGHSPVMVDSLDFLPAYSKENIKLVIDGKRDELGALVTIPASAIFELGADGLEGTTQRIFKTFSEKGIGDIVVKPTEKPREVSSAAFFYNTQNSYHSEQLQYTLGRLQRRGMNTVIVEEAFGTGIAGGRKTELRVFAFGQNSFG